MTAVSIAAVFLSKRDPEATEDVITTSALSNMPKEFLNR